MNTEHEVQKYLYEHIPLSKAMEVRVLSASILECGGKKVAAFEGDFVAVVTK